MKMHRRQFLSTILAAGALSGCGFHLRGEMQLPFKSVHIVGDPNHRLVAELRRQLRLNNVEIRDELAGSDLVIRMLQMKRERDILSLDAGGKAREYRLRYVLGYGLYTPEGKAVRTPATINARREYTFDTRQLLAKTQEEDILYRDMEDDLVRQFMRRLSTVGADEFK